MRKHFLILMLMALLPLASWAQTATFGEASVGKFTYGDPSLPAVVVKDSQNSILTEGTHYEVSDKAYAEEACTTEVAMTALKGGETYYLKITGVGAYVGQERVVHFPVAKKTLTITVSKALNRTYGVATEPTLASTDWSGDGFVYEQGKSALTGSLQYTYAGKGNKATPAGEYAITFSGLTSDNYDIKLPTDKKFTINPIDLTSETVSVKDGTEIADKTYKGYTYTAGDLSGLVLKYGTTELTQGTDFDVTLDVIYNFSSYSAETGGTNYSNGTVCMLSQDGTDAIVEVVTNPGYDEWVGKKFKVALTANNTTRVQLYGDGTGNEYTTASGVWVSVSASTLAKDVNTYSYGVKFKGNYSGTKTNVGNFDVKAAPVIVSMDNLTKTYNGVNIPTTYNLATAYSSQLKFNYSGLVGEDLNNATAVKNDFTAPTTIKLATAAKDVNTEGYTLNVSGANVGTGASKNYYIAGYVPGKLIINKAKLELKAKAANKACGEDDPEFELTATTTGLVSGHVIDGVTFTRDKVGTTEGEAAGSYDITPIYTDAKVYSNFGTVDQKDETGNYEFGVAETKGQLTIGKGTIYVTIKDDNKFYGEADPEEFDYDVLGLTGGDVLGAFTITRDGANTDAGEKVGNYALTAEVANPNPAKYEDVVVANGIFTIKKALLTFTIPAQNVVEGNTKAALKKDNITVAGINKDADKGTGSQALYTLDFNNEAPNNVTLDTNNKITDEDKTYAGGILLTLTPDAQANYAILADDPTTTDVIETAISCTGKLIVNDGDAIGLNLTLAATDYDLIKSHAGETENVTINFSARNTRTLGEARKWKAGYWNTLVLPFDISVADLSLALGYAIVNVINPERTVVSGTSSKFYGKLTMTGGNGKTNVLAANKPFLVKTAGDITGVRNFGVQTIVAPANEADLTIDAGHDCKFVGTYTKRTVTKDDDVKIWFTVGNLEGWAFINADSDKSWDILPTEAYIDMSEATGVRSMTFVMEELDGSTTTIGSINAENAGSKLNVDGWFTLNGVKLQGAPTQKGIYINNGKKVVIK